MKTSASDFTIASDFPPVNYDQWRALAEEAIHGAAFERKLVTHTYEGIDIQPVYGRRDQLGDGDPLGFPGLSPFVRGSRPLGAVTSGWDVRPEFAHPEIAATNHAILEDLAGGATSMLLRLDRAAGQGFDPDDAAARDDVGRDGIAAYGVDDLDKTLKDVHLEMVAVTLDARAAFLPAAASLAALWRRRGVSADEVSGAFNADPLAVLARDGHLPISAQQAFAQLADLARWTDSHLPQVTAIGVDTSPYHDAGATAAQDIAFAMATAVEYLRAVDLDIDRAARQILFRMGLGTHHFLALAKLRAARRLWARVVEASGGSTSARAMRIHARTSNRVLTRRDPYVNLLRNTVAVFAAGLGGAEAITSLPFDTLTGQPDEFSRRVARNTVLVLQEESHLHRVVDPAGGSWFLDQLTEQLAEKSWQWFQQVEQQGGMLAGVQSGWVAEQIDAAYAPRARDIARRKQGITGVSEFPNLSEEQPAQPAPDPDAISAAASKRVASTRNEAAGVSNLTSTKDMMSAAVDAAADGATIGQIARGLGFHQTTEAIAPLEPRSFAEPFEELRDASDAWLAQHGQRPRIFMANVGPSAQLTARVTYVKNFFEAGGFEVVSLDGFEDAAAATSAFAQSGASVVVICSTDRLYPELVPELAPRLTAAGARHLLLAGRPGENSEAWKAAGVERFVFVGCDVLETLQALLRDVGVLEDDEEQDHD